MRISNPTLNISPLFDSWFPLFNSSMSPSVSSSNKELSLIVQRSICFDKDCFNIVEEEIELTANVLTPDGGEFSRT